MESTLNKISRRTRFLMMQLFQTKKHYVINGDDPVRILYVSILPITKMIYVRKHRFKNSGHHMTFNPKYYSEQEAIKCYIRNHPNK